MIRSFGALCNQITEGMQHHLRELGGFTLFIRSVWRTLTRTRGNLDAILTQIISTCLLSLPTVIFAGIFVGAILVIQFMMILREYDASNFLGGLNTSAVVREVGPLIISFLLAGRIGAFTAAELGTMRVTEQIEAIECLGTDPIQYLVVPRFVGIVVSSLILVLIGLLVSVAGSMTVAQLVFGINPLQYSNSMTYFIGPWTFFCGMFKTLIYSLIVAGVSLHKGFTASGGALGVGRAVTLAAIYTNFYIVVSNYVTSSFLQIIHEMGTVAIASYLGRAI